MAVDDLAQSTKKQVSFWVRGGDYLDDFCQNLGHADEIAMMSLSLRRSEGGWDVSIPRVRRQGAEG